MIFTDLFASRDMCHVCGQTPCNCTHIAEEKVRLDPKCWSGKKIGNPKTKMKGGVRVNNCVPAESVEEDLTRRGLLKGIGAAAVAGAGLSPMPAKARFFIWIPIYPYGGAHFANACMPRDVQIGQKVNHQGEIQVVQKIHGEFPGCKNPNMPIAVTVGKPEPVEAPVVKEPPKQNLLTYGQKIAQRIKPNMIFKDLIEGNPACDVEIKVDTDGTITNVRIAKPSENPEWDQAVVKAIYKTQKLPLDVNGTIPPEFLITWKAKDAQARESVEENYDNGEYSDEAGMAHGNLITIAKAARGLLHTIDRHEDLPEWVQEKIAKVEGMLVTAWNYLQSQEAQGIDPRVSEMYANLAENWQRVSHRLELNQEFDLIESIVESIADRNGVDAETVWADLESLTEDELYVFAVTSEPIMEDWQKANKRDKTDGMSRKAVKAYRREHPGSKLQTAVTTKPSKLKKGSKASKRRKSYCSRSRGQMKMHHISCAKTPDKAICKARRRWNCEGAEPTQTMLEGDVVPFKRAAASWQKLPRDVLSLANDWFWADYESGGLQATMDPKGLGSGIANQQKYLSAQLQQRGWAIDIDDEFENVVLKNRQGQTILLPIEDAQDFTGWAQGTNPVSEQGMAEGDKLPGTPVVSLSDFGDKDNTKDRYGRTVPRKLKKDDPRVRFHKDYSQHEKKLIGKMSNAEKADKGWRNPNVDEGVAEGSLNEISADLISRARDAAGRKWAAADDRKDKKASKKYNAQDSRLTDRLNAKKSKEQGVAEVSDATLTSYLTKVHTDSQKHDRDPTKRSPEKRNKSVSGFARAFNKLDARKEKVDELSKQKLGDYLHAAHQDVVDRATSSSFQSGKAGDKYNRADVSPKEKQRQVGMARAVSRLTRENSMADELARLAMKRNPNALVRVDGKTLQSPAPGPKPAGTTAPRPAPKFDPEAEYSDDYSVWHRRTKGLSEGSSIAEAWARRYPNLHADIAECKSSGDGERLNRLMAIKNIIDSELSEQAGLGFGQ